MNKSILIILIGKRKESAVTVQQVLTAWGCIIKTRLGLHDGVLEDCTNQGTVICELCGTKEQNEELVNKVSVIQGVSSKLVTVELEEK
jgi:hypothetical protein